MLLRVNAIQLSLTNGIISYAQNSLGLPVNIKRVNIISLNKLEIDSILLNDLSGDTLAALDKIILHLSIPHLLNNQIRVNNLTLGNPTVRINRETPTSPTNAQFILDMLSGNDSTPSSPLPHIRVNQLHLYDGKFSYDIHSSLPSEEKQFNPSHINVDNITATISLKELSSDSLRLHIRRISCREQSGFSITNATARLTASNNKCTIEQFKITLPNGHIALKDNAYITYSTNDTDRLPRDIKISGNIYSKKLSLHNLSAFIPQLAELPSILQFNTPFTYTDKGLSIQNATVTTADKEISAKYDIRFNPQNPSFSLSIDESHITTNSISTLFNALSSSEMPEYLRNIGDISLNGNIEYTQEKLLSTINIESESGNIYGNIAPSATGGHNCTLQGKDINLGKLLSSKDFGKADATINITYNGTENDFPQCYISSQIANFTYKGYHYSPIRITTNSKNKKIELRSYIDDKYLESDATLSIDMSKRSPKLFLNLNVDTICPHNLALINNNSQSTLSFSFESKLESRANGIDLDSTACIAKIKDFTLRTPDRNHKNDSKYRKIDNINIVYDAMGLRKSLTVGSNWINCYLTGDYTFNTLHNSFLKLLDNHLPSLLQEELPVGNNNFVFGLRLKDSEILEELSDLPFSITEMSYISGNCNDENRQAVIKGNLNGITISNKPFKNIDLSAEHKSSGIHINIAATNQPDETGDDELEIQYRCVAHNDSLRNAFSWHTTNKEKRFDVSKLNFDIAMSRSEAHELQTSVHIPGSTIYYDNKQWNISDAQINSKGNSIDIHNLSASNDYRKIAIDGAISENSKDSLHVELEKISVAEVMNLVNFHSVEFDGTATGKVSITGLLGSTHYNGTLDVDSFLFENGYMGHLVLKSNWRETEKAIYINGLIKDKEYTSIVDGIVSPANDSINLQISADGTNAGFLNSMISSIVSDVELRAYGDLAIRGKLSKINLYGDLQTIGRLKIKSTNTTYNVHGEDSLHFTHNRIGFDHFRIYDYRDSCGTINGSIDHQALKNWTCSFDIKADNMQAFDTHTFNDDGYYGTAFITGGAQLRSDKSGLFLNVDAVAQSGSKFIYNSAGPLGAANNKFVTFVDRNKKTNRDLSLPAINSTNTDGGNLRLEFKIGVNPDIQLRVYTNTVTGDYIDIYSRGTIDVIHDEKEDFKMAGNLEIERGTYKFTLQNIFPKEFAIRSGSIKFNGKPFDAALDLHTAYTIPSVPLTDLNLTAGRRNSVKVDCLMDISGTLQEPALSFGLQLPEGNEEERELLSSSISTPEQTNMQFMYLVAIGKFYTYDYNNMNSESQSSTMMESLISSTISGQLNNMLSQITDNGNWNISGNFTTNERGWNSMEVEGMITGRLLNNRLIINGNLGYRDNPYTNRNFIGDIDIQYILDKKGIFSLKGYSKTNDRYFSRTDLTTQGTGIMLQHEFNKWFNWKKKKKKKDTKQKD